MSIIAQLNEESFFIIPTGRGRVSEKKDLESPTVNIDS